MPDLNTSVPMHLHLPIGTWGVAGLLFKKFAEIKLIGE